MDGIGMNSIRKTFNQMFQILVFQCPISRLAKDVMGAEKCIYDRKELKEKDK